MEQGVELEAIHPAVAARFNDRDLDGLMRLYAPDATMILHDGSSVTGSDGIREQWSQLIETGGRLDLRSRYAIEAGDIAILSNEWTLRIGAETMSAVTAEVAARQPGGGWLYVVDHPFAGLEPDDLAAPPSAMAPPGA
ncbi:YybH family protein [Pseudonocardia sichuanensis]